MKHLCSYFVRRLELCLKGFSFVLQLLLPLYISRFKREYFADTPRTKPIASLPDWRVNGIINTMKYMLLKAQVCLENTHVLDGA
jgi:hypothetical protein